MDVVAMITAASEAIAAVSKQIEERSELHNTPAMQKYTLALYDAAVVKKIELDIEFKNIDELRKDMA
jgi:hypothetical protein